jgi:hypothetical protein
MYICNMSTQFEHLGYAKDYFIADKYIGTERCEHTGPTGYDSRTDQVAEQAIRLGKKRIPAGAKYWTIVNPLCGKFVKA